MLQRRFPVLGSSVDPQKLALSVKGVLLGLVPILVIIFTNVGLDVSSGELTEIVNAIVACVSAVAIIVGVVRKIKNR